MNKLIKIPKHKNQISNKSQFINIQFMKRFDSLKFGVWCLFGI